MTEPTMILAFSWRDLETQLQALAQGPAQRALIPHFISAVQKQAPFLSRELLLREILAMAACVSDARFPEALSPELSLAGLD